MKAIWNGTVVAESDDIVTVEGNAYFPLEALKPEHFSDSDHTSRCWWKGTASYLNVQVGGEVNENAAWTYKDPSAKASHIKDRVAFWRGVQVVP